MGTKHYDSDLESALGIIDCVIGDFELMYWQNFPSPFRTDDTKEFILHSLRLEPPPALIVTGCLLTIGLVIDKG